MLITTENQIEVSGQTFIVKGGQILVLDYIWTNWSISIIVGEYIVIKKELCARLYATYHMVKTEKFLRLKLTVQAHVNVIVH